MGLLPPEYTRGNFDLMDLNTALCIIGGVLLGAGVFYTFAIAPLEKQSLRRKIALIEHMGFVWIEGWVPRPPEPKEPSMFQPVEFLPEEPKEPMSSNSPGDKDE